MQTRSGQNAVTLTEILVVMAVLAVLICLLLPALDRSQGAAQTARCLSQLRQLGVALSLYADDHTGRLPMAHAEVSWTNTQPPPWTRPLLPFYQTTNVLTCPSYRRVHRRSPFSYFMGARAAFIEAGGQPASVVLTQVQFPAQYILSGDCNFPFAADDADPDNYTEDTLFGTNRLGHGGQVNLLHADTHTASARDFDAAAMTYSLAAPGMDWSSWDY
jgi:prepilin-type N-terminal cleavage/methylation domain-containing protein/prepilin-type processing-associated H-X9-DG protein